MGAPKQETKEMSKKCDPPCIETAELIPDEGQTMIAQHGNKKYKEGEKHPRCEGCVEALMKQAEFEINNPDIAQMMKEIEMKIKKMKGETK